MKTKTKILVTCFEPFGIKGNMFKRNESKEIAIKLKEKYGFNILILPVKKSCIKKLKMKLRSYRPDIVICMGQSDYGFRVEGMCFKENKILYSKFAQDIKDGLRGFVKDNIGSWFCNDVYFESLSRVPKTVFIHIPIFTKFRRVDRIVRFILKTEGLNNSYPVLNNGRS